MEFKQPPIVLKESGEIRKVGFELEFGHSDLDTISKCIIELYGGVCEEVNNFLYKIKDTALGDFKVKIDSMLLTEKKFETVTEKFGLDGNKGVEKLVESIASIVVPYEVDTPPVPISEVYKLDALRELLQKAKATGTKTSILHRYATHINAELPALDVKTILIYLRAFVLLYPWIFDHSKIDFSRKLSSFFKPFPDEYVKLVLQRGYNPDLDTFIEDFHKYNPDRNRPLDLYPVLAFIAPEKISVFQNIGSVKPRPTFHYRLPNSLVDDPNWSLASEWNCWIAVENLAANPGLVRELSKEYLEMDEHTFLGFKNKWIRRTEEWVKC